jgi:hypothetical protein
LRLGAGDAVYQQRRASALEGDHGFASVRPHDIVHGAGVKVRARLLMERGVAREEMIVRPEDTLRAVGISSRREARYQRRMSNLLAGR